MKDIVRFIYESVIGRGRSPKRNDIHLSMPKDPTDKDGILRFLDSNGFIRLGDYMMNSEMYYNVSKKVNGRCYSLGLFTNDITTHWIKICVRSKSGNYMIFFIRLVSEKDYLKMIGDGYIVNYIEHYRPKPEDLNPISYDKIVELLYRWLKKNHSIDS